MPANNQVHLRGEVADRPYFDLVPARHHDGRDRIAFLRVLIWVQRDTDQPQPEDRLPADQSEWSRMADWPKRFAIRFVWATGWSCEAGFRHASDRITAGR